MYNYGYKIITNLFVISQISCGNTLKKATNRSAKLRCTIIKFIRESFLWRLNNTTSTTTLPITASAKMMAWTAISYLASCSSRVSALRLLCDMLHVSWCSDVTSTSDVLHDIMTLTSLLLSAVTCMLVVIVTTVCYHEYFYIWSALTRESGLHKVKSLVSNARTTNLSHDDSGVSMASPGSLYSIMLGSASSYPSVFSPCNSLSPPDDRPNCTIFIRIFCCCQPGPAWLLFI